ncbi:hypothetical protein DAPPUDRAFT_256153 [Daphnia pulex]|uniref:C1q domain-containing protein n=1 Tax=Daphnia pulex TaxID=6669 RepID=E9HAV8_DAPPU|nr:hypothetical protein DAPPUDRAFT_256153 [Daphnia pulex]|eukprot:EFX71099.1 hypothetical protein DAPPUDRAFT_256153 [Daphnia pulex]
MDGINVGNPMNLPTGIFGAPRPGKYYFRYSGISESNEGRVLLQMKTETEDWFTIGQGYSATTFETFSLQSTLQLLKGDRIRMFLLRGSIHDNAAHYTNFVGRLVEENVFE